MTGKCHTTIYEFSEDWPEWGIDFHVDHLHKTDEMHFVHYDPRGKHDMEGYTLSKDEAIKVARAILERYGVAT